MRKLDIIFLAVLALLLAVVAAALTFGRTATEEAPDPQSLAVHPPREELRVVVELAPPRSLVIARISASEDRADEITGETENPATSEENPVIDEAEKEAEPAGTPWTQEDVEYLARTMWGEARGCTVTEQAAVAWCVLNRVDDPRFPNTVREVVTAPYQFAGYIPGNPVEPDMVALAADVLTRWAAGDDAGRVLPREYVFFSGDGIHNTYTTEYFGGDTWDWSIASIYEEEKNV